MNPDFRKVCGSLRRPDIATVILTAAVGTGLFFLSLRFSQKLADQTEPIDEELNGATARAEELLRVQEYPQVLAALDPYRSQMYRQHHIAGMKMYAEARAAIPEPSNRHIAMAAAMLVRVAELDSTDPDTHSQLFRLFSDIGDYDSAISYGKRAVALAPSDLHMRLDLGRTFLNSGDIQAARGIATNVLENNSDCLEAAVLHIQCSVVSGISDEEILPFIDEFCSQAMPTAKTDRTLLLIALAQYKDDLDGVKLLSSLLAPTDLPATADNYRFRLLTEALSIDGRYEASAEAAHRLVEGSGISSEEKRTLIYRLLQSGEYGTLQQTCRQVLQDRCQYRDECLIVRFLGFWLTGQDNELPMLAEQVAKETTHLARVWAPLLNVLTASSPKPKEIAAIASEAIQKLPQSAQLKFILAGSLQALGESDAAISEYRRSIELAPRWAVPRAELCKIQLLRREYSSALAEAIQLQRCRPIPPETLDLILISSAEILRAGGQLSPATKEAITATLATARLNQAHPHALKILDALTHYFNRDTNAADKSVVNVLDTSSRRLTAGDIEILSAIATKSEVKVHVLSVKRDRFGASATELIETAINVARKRGEAAAWQYLNTTRIAGGPLAAASRDLLFARVLSAIDSARARAAWIDLGERNKENLQILRQAVRAKELADDFVNREKLIHLMKAASPPNAIDWRICDALLTLDRDTSQEAAAGVALRMCQLTKMTPSAEAACVTALAYERLNRPNRALSVLKESAAVGAGSVLGALKVAELSVSATEAVRHAKLVLRSRGIPDAFQNRAICVLLRHGCYTEAAGEMGRRLPETVTDSDEDFRRFSAFAVARAHAGTVTDVLGLIEQFAMQSDRWFQLWIDLTDVVAVPPDTASAMLVQAKAWLLPDDTKRSLSLSRAWGRLARRHPTSKYLEKAWSGLRPLVTEHSPLVDQMMLANLASRTGNSEVAAELYRRITNHDLADPGSRAVAFNNLALLKSRMDDELTVAESLSRQALDLEQRPEFVDTLVEILIQQKRSGRAVALLQKSLQSWPHNRRLNLLLSKLRSAPAGSTPPG